MVEENVQRDYCERLLFPGSVECLVINLALNPVESDTDGVNRLLTVSTVQSTVGDDRLSFTSIQTEMG
jgi:hypothetical protein